MKIKTTVRYHYTPIRTAKIQSTDVTKCSPGCGATGTLIIAGGNINWCSNHFGTQFGSFLPN